jgi:multimeric flavodoxin WrbA
MNSIMSKLLILNGSPVRGSSTDVLSEKIAEGAHETGWQCETVYLNDLVITPCQACGARDDDDICIYHDDLYSVLNEFANCDAVVTATPVYFDTVSAQMKLFVDRCNCFRPMRKTDAGQYHLERKRWKRRKGIIVLVGGNRQKFDCAVTVLKGLFKWTGVEFVDSVFYSHEEWEPGGVCDDLETLSRAAALGSSLSA